MTRPVIRIRVTQPHEGVTRWELTGAHAPGDEVFLARHISHLVHQAETQRIPLAHLAAVGDGAVQVEAAHPVSREGVSA